MKTYHELLELDLFNDRLRYLKLRGKPGVNSEDADRFFAEVFYRGSQWKRVRAFVLVRDDFCDLGIKGLKIPSGAIVHHIEALTMLDIIEGNNAKMFGHDNLITASLNTHNLIHYGVETMLPVERFKNDTAPWKKG